MNIFQTCTFFLGRLFLSGIFLISAIQEMLDWTSTEQYFLMSMTRWMNGFQGSEMMGAFFTAFLPWMPWCLLIAVVLKLLGSFLLILGLNIRLGAVLLILFLIPATLIVHDFWALPVEEKAIGMVLFMKNVSILGGLLVVLALGKGKSASKSA